MGTYRMHGKSEEETSSTREHEAMRAAEILKVNKIEFWRQPDGKFEADAFNVNRLKDKIQSMKTDIIYVPHEGEDHQDHKAAASLVMQAISEPVTTFTKPLVWMYEVWTPIQKIDHIVDISPYVDIKREAILCHKSQCDVLKFDEAILGLNRYRGEMHSCPGGDFAEVFTNLKESN